MHALEVGKPYIAGRASIEPRGEYNFRGGQHELVLAFSGLDSREVEAVREDDAEFALVVSGDAIFFLYRFGDEIGWSDAPYSWHLVPADQREQPEMPANVETRALLSIVLVDADHNIVQALRAVTFSPEFTRKLHAAIRHQAGRPWNRAVYDRELREAYKRWPTTESMLRAEIARTLGGA